MLTLTITDPHQMTAAEKAAVLAFVRITGVDRPFVPDATIEPDSPLVIPRVTEHPFSAPTPAPAAVVTEAAAAIDAAKIFGGAPASSVPLPPATGSTVGSDGASAAPAASSIPTPPAATTASPLGPVPAPTAAGPSAGVDLDSRGLPWDVRIHASTKGKNADGGWKKKKNVDAAQQTAVEAELRALMGITAAPAPLKLPAGAEAVAEGQQPTTFPQLMGWVTKAVADGKLTQADVAAVVMPIGLASVVGLNMRPDLIPEVLAQLQAVVDSKVPA